jgi:hypothetical protein
MAFTLGAPEQQAAFLRRNKELDFNIRDVQTAMTEKAISLKHVNFDFDQYQGPVTRDLFGEDIWLTDRKLVAELQDRWAADEVEALKQQGYDKVEILSRDDWQTLNNTVEVTGKISAETRATLACYLTADHYGLIVVHKNRISRKKVDDKGKIIAKKHSADETPVETIKPMLCTELTVAQQEIVNAYAASEIYTQVVEGDELLAKFLVVDRMFGKGTWTGGNLAFEHNGTIRRWERLNEAYPAEQLIIGKEIDAMGMLEPAKLDFAAWKAMTPKTRQHLFLQACAAMIYVPHMQTELKKDLPELAGKDWFVPCGDFFKRYRTDQLIDYRRRSGDKEAGETAKKKGDHVADCIVAATLPTAFKLGLYPKRVQTEPKKTKKLRGGVPDEA